jgi:hypothetical protein
VAVALTLVQAKEIRINTHKLNNTNEHSTRHTPNEIGTIQSITLSIKLQ